MTDYTVEDVLDMDNYSINQLDEYFQKNKCEILVFNNKYSDKWKAKLTKEDDGVKIEITSEHKNLYAALYDVYEKFNKTAKHGAPNLLVPVIEHKPMSAEETKKLLDDDIPF